MVNDQHPDPERQRLGRLGALSVHARGRTNVAPARAAWVASLADKFGITDELPVEERSKRLDYAMRVRMTELARTRWTTRKARPDRDSGRAELEGHDRDRPAA